MKHTNFINRHGPVILFGTIAFYLLRTIWILLYLYIFLATDVLHSAAPVDRNIGYLLSASLVTETFFLTLATYRIVTEKPGAHKPLLICTFLVFAETFIKHRMLSFMHGWSGMEIIAPPIYLALTVYLIHRSEKATEQPMPNKAL